MIPGTATAIGVAKAALETGKALLKLAQEYDKLELKTKVVELMGQVTELAEENARLHMELGLLQQHLQLEGELLVKRGHYYRRKADGGEDGPFCTRCYDVDRRLVRLPAGSLHNEWCPQCGWKGNLSKP